MSLQDLKQIGFKSEHDRISKIRATLFKKKLKTRIPVESAHFPEESLKRKNFGKVFLNLLILAKNFNNQVK